MGLGRGKAEHLHNKGSLYLGIDVGSTSSDIVVLDEVGETIFCDYHRTLGGPIETVHSQLVKMLERISPSRIELTAITGSTGRTLAALLDAPFVNEVTAQAAAIQYLYPHFRQMSVIEMGGQDSKLIFLTADRGQGRIRDFTINTVCAAGTGSFLDQQAQRLGVNIENEFGQMALQSKNIPRMAGRCSVFAKSDMIHLQQQATPMCDIIAGLCLALARNLKSNLGCGREFARPIVFTGGVAANIGVVRAIEQVFEIAKGELIVPDKHFFTGAIGAVLAAKGRFGKNCPNARLYTQKLDDYLNHRSSALKTAPRCQQLCEPKLSPQKSEVYEHLLDAAKPVNAYLGLDVGSISTKIAVIDEQKRVLAKIYLMTAGKPLDAVRQCLDIVGRKVCGRIKILGAATTGSGRYLTGDFIGADVVINEITAQAKGAAIINPKVDTIFEIGGQDSKYISLENGVVVDFEMNHACAAGTGSFLEEQAQRLGINIKGEFAELAFKCRSPIKLGERCTVFMESDLLSYQQQGAKTDELVAGLSYSIVTNYLNRVVGRRKIGSNICFQGGTAFNRAVWSAFEKITGKPIIVPDHHEVTGAIGAAAIAAEHISRQDTKAKSKFKGFENLVNVSYTVESFTCEHCSNHCEIKKVQLAGAEPLYYGSRCDRYNLKKKTQKKTGFDAFEYRNSKLLEFAGLDGKRSEKTDSRGRIGIPMALINRQLLPLFGQFFKSLGFEVVLSGRTDRRIIRLGVETVAAQTCFPVKVAYGHIIELLNKNVDHIFLPSVVSMMPGSSPNKHNQACPYVQSFAYQVRSSFAAGQGREKILTVPIRLGENRKLLMDGFLALGRKLGVPASAVRRAVNAGLSAQAGFEQAIKDKGREILNKIGPDDKLFVLVSRPYNGCDEGMNLELPNKLSDFGVNVIPMDMLALDEAKLGDEQLHSRLYWSYGQKILRAAEIIKRDKRLFAIYLSNFGCGPDSFLMTFFKDIMAQKPCLQLELDEHSADAGLLTRLEAFLDSLKHYKGDGVFEAATTAVPKKLNKNRTLYLPYMSDCAYGIAACFKAYGQPAEVIPIADEDALLQGRAFTTGKECLPCAITAGDMLKITRSAGFDPEKAAFFMPSACGPCRFGMYNQMHRLILKYAGAGDIPIVSPNQDDGFYSEFTDTIGRSAVSAFMKDMWISVVGIDLLFKVLLRLRPFARDARQAQRVYERAIAQWVQAVENRSSFYQMRRLMKSIADEFAEVEIEKGVRKPLIGIVGEIYVRSHPFANSHIIRRLEELGAVCDLATLAEWIYYTNFTRKALAGRREEFRNWCVNAIQNRLQRGIEKSLAGPLEKKFGKLAEGPVEHIIELAEPYMHHSFEGEAIMSVGKIIEYYHQGAAGVVNVMPFTCMPSTVVSTQTQRISADCGDIPILNLSFDGQEDAALTTRLEAFVEQVRQKAGAAVSAAEIML